MSVETLLEYIQTFCRNREYDCKLKTMKYIERKQVLLTQGRTILYRPYLPPLKNSPCTNSSTPNSSRPMATSLTLFSSSRGFSVLNCFAPRRQKGHPNRRRKVITHGPFCQNVSIATF